MKIRFIGALGTVTGSCTLFTHHRRYSLVDCGATQGNDAAVGPESELPFKANGIDRVFLTHAHLDHCGMLPQLVKQGFRGDVYCTRATADLTRLALTDAASLPKAQFSSNDVERLRFVCPDERPEFQFGKFFGLDANLSVALIRTSHILGSVGFEFQYAGAPDGKPASRKTIVFSGDIGCNVDGNCYQSLLNARQYPSTYAEYVVCESTYGSRDRDPQYADHQAREESIKALLLKTAACGPGATIIFPCFTLQRMQDLLVDLHSVLEQRMGIGDLARANSRNGCANDRSIEVFVDSPLAKNYGGVFIRELQRLRENGKPLYLNPELAGRLNLDREKLVALLSLLLGGDRTAFTTYALNYGPPPLTNKAALRIILAGAGMCNGGRVMQHLKRCLPLGSTTVAITGYQGFGTPGGELMKRVKYSGADIDGAPWDLASMDVKAHVVDLSGYYSGHTDRAGLLDFILHKNSRHQYESLKRVFLNHGDNQARAGLQNAIRKVSSQGHDTNRIVGLVELPNAGSCWFDLNNDKWVDEYHSVVDPTSIALASGLSRLQKLEVMVQALLDKGPDAISLDKITNQLNIAKYQLASARLATNMGE